VKRTAKLPSIFVARVNNFLTLSQQLKKIAFDEYEIKIMNEQIKIQPRSSIVYVSIMKELKSRNTYNSTYINQSKRGVSE